MKLLRTIRDQDLFPGEKSLDESEYKLRQAARIVVFDTENKVGLLHVTKDNYFKLPGGGIDPGKDVQAALSRECQEELGCNVVVEKEIGLIIELRNQFKEKQESYCFQGRVVGEKGKPNFTQEEIEDGFKILWVSLDEAISLIEESQPVNYMGKYTKIRDLLFLNSCQNNISNALKNKL